MDTTLKRIPLVMTLLFIVFLGLPTIVLNVFEIDVAGLANLQTRLHLTQMLIQGSLFSLAMVTTLLSFLHFRLTRDAMALAIGLTLSITQLGIAIDLWIIPHQSPLNGVSSLELMGYFIPLSCFILYYVFSYSSLLQHQKKSDLHHDKLTYMASHDVLTNLYNRREFENILNRTIANHERSKTSFALFLIDLDDFKTINDAFGHLQGDLTLKRVADQLSIVTRQGDVLSRLGGDEFTVIMNSVDSPASVRKLASRILKVFHTASPSHDSLYPLTLSIGISIYPHGGKNSEELLKHADLAMYHAKKSGKNTYQIYTKKQKMGKLSMRGS